MPDAPMPDAPVPDAITALRAALGDAVVRTGDAIGARCRTDWTQHAPASPAALLLPRSTAEVAVALRICNEHGQGVVPQGGLTGLAGGAVPRPQDVCLSLERMAGIEEIDRQAATLTALAGTTLQAVQEAAAQAGLHFALDLGARGSCQIGGNIATNAGGHTVIRYGMARDLVLGLEVVLADGTVLRSLNKMIKNNAGYDLKQWFIGSEGTLGVVTRAVLRLHPRPAPAQTALCALPDYDAAVRLLRRVQEAAGAVVAFELLWQDFYRLGVSWLGGRPAPLPDTHPLYVLLEVEGQPGGAAPLDELLEAGFADGSVLDAVLARSHADARGLWAVREATGEFPARLDPVNFDISLPIGAIGGFVAQCREKLQARWPEHRSFFFGHIGDSNLHLTVDGRSIPGVPHAEVDALVYAALREIGGSVSAEHGIGLLKRGYLACSRTAEEIDAMRRIKRALDPRGILNPGKLFA